MKRKLLLVGLQMLTVCALWSQDTINDSLPHSPDRFSKPVRAYAPNETTDIRPICFPFWMVKRIALDLEEKRRLEAVVKLDSLELAGLRSLVEGLEQQGRHRELQLELLQKQSDLLQLQLKAEKHRAPPRNTLTWTLRLLLALGAGYFLGSIGT